MKPRIFILAALFCLLLSASATPAPAKDTWTSVRSKNFYLIGNASEKEIRQVATKMEQFRFVFSHLMPNIKFTSPVPTTIVVFKSDSSYKSYKPVVDGKTSSVAGYFQPGNDINYITLTTEKGEENPFSTIFHEYVHLLVNNTLGEANVPPWFNEGLAEYYSTFDIEDNQKVWVGKPISNHVYMLRQQKLIPLQTLFGVDNYSLHRNKREARSVFYAQSWALMHYLILGNGGQRHPQLGRFLNLVLDNKPVDKAFQEAFQTDFAGMEKELKSYVGHDTFKAQIAIWKQKLELDSEIQSAPLSEAEAFAHLGDLLRHTNRLEDADARLKQSLALDPTQPLALASLGMVRMEQKRFAEARELLKKAVDAGTQNYLAHYYYAFVMSRDGMNDDQMISTYPQETARLMRAELKKAIELKPDYPESYRLLAFVNLVMNEELDESAAMLRKALSLSPGNQSYALLLAQFHMRKYEFAQAKALLAPLAQSAGEPELRAGAQALLNAVSEMEARMGSRSRPSGIAAQSSARTDAESGLRPNRRGEASNAPTSGAAATPPPEPEPVDPMSYLREALRPPVAGETRVQGMLVRIDCEAKGVVFIVRVGEKLLKLHTAAFEEMDISTYTQDIKGEMGCGARTPENLVVFTYRPASGPRARYDGEAVALEFVPKDFVLEKK